MVKVVRFTQDNLVFSSSERIPKQRDGVKIDIAVTALGLVRAGSVEIPHWKIFRSYWLEIYSLGFTAHPFTGSIDPNIQHLDSLALIKAHVFVEKRVAFRRSHVSGIDQIFDLRERTNYVRNLVAKVSKIILKDSNSLLNLLSRARERISFKCYAVSYLYSEVTWLSFDSQPACISVVLRICLSI